MDSESHAGVNGRCMVCYHDAGGYLCASVLLNIYYSFSILNRIHAISDLSSKLPNGLSNVRLLTFSLFQQLRLI